MKLLCLLTVLALASLSKPTSGYPIDDTQSQTFNQIMDSMEKLKQSDAEIWIDFMRFRRYTKYDIDSLVYKINELVQEVNRLKGMKNYS